MTEQALIFRVEFWVYATSSNREVYGGHFAEWKGASKPEPDQAELWLRREAFAGRNSVLGVLFPAKPDAWSEVAIGDVLYCHYAGQKAAGEAKVLDVFMNVKRVVSFFSSESKGTVFRCSCGGTSIAHRPGCRYLAEEST